MGILDDRRLVERVTARLDAVDDKAAKMMLAGTPADWGQYQRKVGYRRAIADVRMFLNEEIEALMKE